MAKSAYTFEELEASGHEGSRLSAQAQAFVDLELPGLLSQIKSDAKVADFGCGTGVISNALAVHLPGGEVVGLDPDPKALEFARKEGRLRQNLRFERFGFGDGSLPLTAPFDVAFTRLVLLHLPDPAKAIEDMARCLKPGGLLYIVDCDDNYVNFVPVEAWQSDLMSLMKEAQASRGGTRTLGSQLLRLVAEAGLWPEGSQVVYYSTQKLGLERWKSIFLPALGNMAERDLQYMETAGAGNRVQVQECRRGLQAFFERPDVMAQLSAWHVWARKPDSKRG